ncbi:MAG: PAS domain S-box protein [Deltaproteobacteria bacterium]|nr:PAS domain S-box protein [Deltaproteobacteria bacterium]
MGFLREHSRRLTFQIVVIAALVVVHSLLGPLLRSPHHTNVVYNHFAYIPIVLACLWWGKRGAFVVVAPTLEIVLFHRFDLTSNALWSDVVRVVFFLAVALVTGWLADRVKSEHKAAVRSEEIYKLLTDKSLTGIIVYRDGLILFANPRMASILGHADPAADILGKTIWDFIYAGDREKVRSFVEKRASGEADDLHYELRLLRRGGKIMWAEIGSFAIDYEGAPAVLVNIYDITEKKEAEEKRKELSVLTREQEAQLVHSTRLAELGEMAAAVAHELNQPLTGIRNYAKNASYMLEEKLGTEEEVKGNLRLISEQVARASKIINQMRELTRRTDSHFAPLNLNAVLRESIDFLLPQLKLSGVELRLTLADGLPDVMGDKVRLEQVFLNIITNARQAMEEVPERVLTIRTGRDPGAKDGLMVEIDDTGPGFSEAVAGKLFTPFFSTKKPGHGTGLGLSISLSILKEHQGGLKASCEVGKGARFVVRLPAADAHAEANG